MHNAIATTSIKQH